MVENINCVSLDIIEHTVRRIVICSLYKSHCWKGFEVHGKKAFVLKEKFRLLKECLRKWNKEVFGYKDLNIEKTVKDLNDIEGLLGGDDVEVEFND
jgi:hypothetical protein